jgi:single-strand DNA-binding protein
MEGYITMQIISIAGTTGKDAEYKTTQTGSEMCSISVAVNGFSNGEKTTTWYNVTSWGKGSEGLARILKKGSKIACSGELSTRDHNGKTYLQIRTNGITVQGSVGGQPDNRPDGSRGGFANTAKSTSVQSNDDDLDDAIPF